MNEIRNKKEIEERIKLLKLFIFCITFKMRMNVDVNEHKMCSKKMYDDVLSKLSDKKEVLRGFSFPFYSKFLNKI
jgi:hypothetical protein